MKEEIFKVQYEKYECILHHNSTPLSNFKPKIIDNSYFLCEGNGPHKKKLKKRSPKLIYTPELTSLLEETYVENYGNPLAKVSKSYTMVVVEKYEDKISLKVFWGFRERKVGDKWFKLSKNVQYITVNVKTGDVYTGFLHNFQKKKKYNKKINKNYFASNPINNIKHILRNLLYGYTTNHYDVSMEAISKFMREIDNGDGIEDLDFEKRLFIYYLNKKNIKYPNNFDLYRSKLVGPNVRKQLKKCDNKLVDAFMKDKGLTGKQLKIALHNCNLLNIELYLKAKQLFGEDWINQESNFILYALNSTYNSDSWVLPTEFIELISKDELRRVFGMFKKVYFSGGLDSYSFHDHIRMYTELKLYGERDLKWTSDADNKESFRNEHLDWTDKIQFYKKGYYDRIYPSYIYDLVQRPIEDYYPVILNNSTSYNEESASQSNCVKTYIGRAQSLIVSLRKGSPNSDDRATIEYQISKDGGKIKCRRVQSLGRFNSKLEEHWVTPIFKLDEYLLSCIKDRRFKTVEITKKCANGSFLESSSEWDDSGVLKWTYKNIENNRGIFDWI